MSKDKDKKYFSINFMVKLLKFFEGEVLTLQARLRHLLTLEKNLEPLNSLFD